MFKLLWRREKFDESCADCFRLFFVFISLESGVTDRYPRQKMERTGPRRSIATKTTTRRESVLGKPFPFINLSWKGARHRAEEPQFGFESQLRGGPLATPWSIDLENFTWPRDPCLRYCRLSRSIGAAVPFQYQEETKNEIFIVPRRYTVYREINFPHLPWNNSSQEEKFVLGAVCARGTYVLGGFT